MNLSAKQLIKILEANNFQYKRAKGSHQVYYNPATKVTVVVPVHGKDLKKGTFLSILKQAGIERREV